MLQARFPDHENAIHRLWGVDKGFKATSQELNQLALKLDRLNARVDSADPNEGDSLKSRRDDLSREPGMLMDANLRARLLYR